MTEPANHASLAASTAVGDLLQHATDTVIHQTSREQALSDLLVALGRAIPVDRAMVWEYRSDDQSMVSVAGHHEGQDWNPEWRRSTDLAPLPEVMSRKTFVSLSGAEMNEFVQSPATDSWRRPAHLIVGPIESSPARSGGSSRSPGSIATTRSPSRSSA